MNNDTIHGKLNNNLNIVKYTGKETDTAKVTVDSTERTISVDVKESGGSSSTSDDIRIKSVKILTISTKVGEIRPLLQIISYPISENIINLVKTTDRVRLKMNGLPGWQLGKGPNRKRKRHRNPGQYYLRASVYDLNETQLNNFFKFKAPQITESMLVTENEKTYIKFELDLQEFLVDKIKAVSGEDTTIPALSCKTNKYNLNPISALSYCVNNPHTVGKSISNNPLALKQVTSYSIYSSGLSTQLLTTPGFTFKDYGCVFNFVNSVLWKRKYLHISTLTDTVDNWIKKMNTAQFFFGLNNKSTATINLWSYPFANETGDKVVRIACTMHEPISRDAGKYKGEEVQDWNSFKDYRTSLHVRHNLNHKNPDKIKECTVFSFGILQEDINKMSSHIWLKSFEKYPAVLKTWYRESCSYTVTKNKKIQTATFNNDIRFNCSYALKPLPKDCYIWK